MEKIDAVEYDEMENFFLPYIKDPILEVGCGQGYNLKYLKKKGFQSLSGIDINKERIIEARKFYPELCFDFHDIANDGIYDSEFKTVLWIESIEHIEKTNETIKNIKNSMADDGYLLITTPNVLSLRNRINFLLGKAGLFCQEIDEPHIRFFSHETLKKKLEQHGFEVIAFYKKSRIPFLPLSLNGSITLIARKKKHTWECCSMMDETIRSMAEKEPLKMGIGAFSA